MPHASDSTRLEIIDNQAMLTTTTTAKSSIYVAVASKHYFLQ